MPHLQRYVSKELTHFIGRALPSDDKRYELLMSILREKCLKHKPNAPDSGEGGGGVLTIPTGNICENEMYKPFVICLCDIPLGDLGIHISKYSRFGLSFPKSFLVAKGANPVFYVANDSFTLVSPGHFEPRGPYFDEVFKRIQEQLDLFKLTQQKGDGKHQLTEEEGWLVRIKMFLDREIFSFIKCFDSSKSEDDQENYYMEREWRVYGNLKFELQDVYRVILPEKYSRRFREEMPDYYGQITFAESTLK